MTHPLAILAVILSTFLGAAGSLFFKFGSKKISLNPKDIIFNFNLILGLFFYGTGSILFIIALKFGELSVLYAFVSLQYIWISLLSIKYLKERMNLLKWLGITLIILGVIAVKL